MYLQLADNGRGMRSQYQKATPPAELLEFMLQIPNEEGGFTWVREDQLDELPIETLYQIVQQQPHLSGIKDFFGRLKQRRSDRKDQKAIDKQAGKQTRFDWRENKRAARTGRKGGGFFERIGGITGNVLTKMQGGDPSQGRGQGIFPQITGQASVGVAQWWQNPMVIGLGALVVIGGVVYFSTKGKKK